MGTSNISEESQVELADAIREIRRELNVAIAEGADEDLRFVLGDIELEFQVAITEDSTTKRGIAIKVLSLGRDSGRAQAKTNTVKIKLIPAIQWAVDEAGDEDDDDGGSRDSESGPSGGGGQEDVAERMRLGTSRWGRPVIVTPPANIIPGSQVIQVIPSRKTPG